MTRSEWFCNVGTRQERKTGLFQMGKKKTRHVRELVCTKTSLSCDSLASVLTQSDAGSKNFTE